MKVDVPQLAESITPKLNVVLVRLACITEAHKDYKGYLVFIALKQSSVLGRVSCWNDVSCRGSMYHTICMQGPRTSSPERFGGQGFMRIKRETAKPPKESKSEELLAEQNNTEHRMCRRPQTSKMQCKGSFKPLEQFRTVQQRSVLPDCTEGEVHPPFASTYTPPFPRVPLPKGEVSTATFRHFQTRPSRFTTVFAVRCCL